MEAVSPRVKSARMRRLCSVAGPIQVEAPAELKSAAAAPGSERRNLAISAMELVKVNE